MKKLIAISALLLAMVITGCAASLEGEGEEESSAAQQSQPVYQKISAEEAKTMMDENEGYILLDVRTEEEYRESRIEGAILLPNDEIKTRAESELPDKESLIFVYCRSGRRSALATDDLLALGYANVYDFGGIIDWPYETISG